MHKKSNDRHKIDTNHETVLYWTIQFVGEGDPFLNMQRWGMKFACFTR